MAHAKMNKSELYVLVKSGNIMMDLLEVLHFCFLEHTWNDFMKSPSKKSWYRLPEVIRKVNSDLHTIQVACRALEYLTLFSFTVMPGWLE